MGITNEKYVSDVPLRERPLNRIGLRIRDKAISNPKIADGAITAEKIVDGAVSERTLANGSITGEKLVDGIVTNEKLANGSITTEKLADGIIENIESVLGVLEERANTVINMLNMYGILSFGVDDDMILSVVHGPELKLEFGLEEGYLYVDYIGDDEQD